MGLEQGLDEFGQQTWELGRAFGVRLKACCSEFLGLDLGLLWVRKKRLNGPHYVQMDLRPIQRKTNNNKMQMKIRKKNNDKSKWD